MNQANIRANVHAKLPELLKSMVYPHSGKPLLTVKEIALLLELADRTIYTKVDECKFTGTELFILASAYAELGEFALINLLLPPNFSVAHYDCQCGVNGSMQDEVTDMVKIIGEIATDFDKGNVKGGMRKLPGVSRIERRMNKELVNATL